jgi:hypothetical protein
MELNNIRIKIGKNVGRPTFTFLRKMKRFVSLKIYSHHSLICRHNATSTPKNQIQDFRISPLTERTNSAATY